MNRYQYKLIIEYDGTDFCGWQVQPGKRTVQGELERALSIIAGSKVKTYAAGRTDSGVHARMQIATFFLEKSISPQIIHSRLARMLPKDMAVIRTTRAKPGFNPRREATRRTYRYYIAETPAPLKRRYSYYYGRPLDLEKLNRCAAVFVGEHDFGLLCKRSSRKPNNVCIIFRSRWFRRSGMLCYEVSADRFLHNMVRRIVGVMLAFERSKLSLTQIEAILNNSFDDQVKYNVPACGLILHEVKFGKVGI